MVERCSWCGEDAQYQAYHDTEWGRPETDPVKLFELLVLESFQSGLNWLTILRKREGFRAAFAGFDPAVVATWGEEDVLRLLGDAGIVRHRGKIEATIANAKGWLALEEEEGFAPFVWSYVAGAPRDNAPETLGDVPGQTAESVALSKALKKRGFKFVGPTTVYAFMQASGMVNDHVVTCERRG